MRDNLKLNDDNIYAPHSTLFERIKNRILNSISLFVVAGLFIITLSIMTSLILLIAEDVHRDDIVVWTILAVLLLFKAILIISAIVLDRNALVEIIILEERLMIIYKKYNKTKVKEVSYDGLTITFKTKPAERIGKLNFTNPPLSLTFYSGGCITHEQLSNIADYLQIELTKKGKINTEQIRIA